MSRVMIFDAATATVAATTMPPGEFQPHLRTSENELCWIRETPEGAKKLVYGSLIVPDNSITMLVEVPYTKDDDVKKLTRPENDVLIDAIFNGSKAITALELMTKTVESKEKEVADKQKEMDKQAKKHATSLSTQKRKAQDAETSAKAARLEADSAKSQVGALSKQQEDLERDFETYKSTVSTTGAGSSSSASKATVDGIYKSLMNKLYDALVAKVPPPAPKKKLPAAAASAHPARGDVVFEFEDDHGNWAAITDSTAIDNYSDLYDAQVAAVTTGTASQLVTASFRMGSYDYQVDIDPSAVTAPALFHYFQTNTSTSKKRRVRCCPSSAPSGAAATDKTQKQKQLDALCGPEFTTTVSKIDAEAMILKHSFEGAPYVSSDAELKGLLAKLGNLFAEYAHHTTKFVYDPAKCEPLVKPFQLRQALALAAGKGVNHCRLVIHGTKNEGLTAMRKDPIGLDMTYCRTSCRYGKANYVATTYDAPEGQGYNGTGVRGKVVLCILMSPHYRIDTQEPSPMYAYQFCSRDKLSNGRNIEDAIAVFGNSHLIPLGILSP